MVDTVGASGAATPARLRPGPVDLFEPLPLLPEPLLELPLFPPVFPPVSDPLVDVVGVLVKLPPSTFTPATLDMMFDVMLLKSLVMELVAVERAPEVAAMPRLSRLGS